MEFIYFILWVSFAAWLCAVCLPLGILFILGAIVMMVSYLDSY